MHLVFATSILPGGRMDTGYEIANAAVLGALKRAGARVTVMGFAGPGEEPPDPKNTVVLGHVEVTTDGAPAARKLRWLADALRFGLTFSSAKLRIITPEEVRKAFLAIGPVDGVILNSIQFAGAFGQVFAGCPIAYVAHNVEYRSAEESAVASPDMVSRLLYRREARLLKKLEEKLCAEACFIFTLANEDRGLLGLTDDSRAAALPLVTREWPPAPTARKPEFDAVLIGTWTWMPNRIGLEWFLAEVVPLLPPSFTVAIAGRVSESVARAHPRVRFLGRVESAADFMRRGRVTSLISQAGTGVQLKTIETFELGLPAVATSHSLRGITHLPENCIVADTPRAFANALQRLASEWWDVNGAAFHSRQLAALDRQIARGLAALGHKAAAEGVA
ncbi:glycosyltransferase family 4 protein [Chelativorans sp. Marseille-P2723]|uniref:glycosyltransferase n=1 Tax=Chelativorans sp. Marseille-P2723 TaxID=2709133 RepID=UPI00156E969E|nr:glycosyltransferase family 4 protein [Chelativorans sp. Marseille-P2723]